MEETVQQLEKRATAAEGAITAMKQQLEARNGSGSNGNGNGDAHLEARLRELLELMLQDREECEAIRAQRDDLKTENERLRQQVSKHEYRIKHLLRTINEIEHKQSS